MVMITVFRLCRLFAVCGNTVMIYQLYLDLTVTCDFSVWKVVDNGFVLMHQLFCLNVSTFNRLSFYLFVFFLFVFLFF